MSQGRNDGRNNDRRDDDQDDEPLAVRIAKEIVATLSIKAKSVESAASVTDWPLLTAVVAVAIAKLDGFKSPATLAFIADFNSGTPTAVVFGAIDLNSLMTSHDLQVRLAAAAVATTVFDEMKIRLGERAGRDGGEQPALKAVPGGKGDSERAAG